MFRVDDPLVAASEAVDDARAVPWLRSTLAIGLSPPKNSRIVPQRPSMNSQRVGHSSSGTLKRLDQVRTVAADEVRHVPAKCSLDSVTKHPSRVSIS